MDLSEELHNGCLCVNLRSASKDDLIVEMVDCLVASGRIRDREAAIAAVLQRERTMSTGMQYGVAVPHGKTDTVDHLVTMVALKKEGIDFQSADGQPARIFVMTLSPVSQAGPHLRYLAAVGRLLSCQGVRDDLLRAETPADMIRVLLE